MEVENMTATDSDEQQKIVALNERIEQLEVENKKIRDEFDVQRAKMKELFLQKEEEFSNEKCRLKTELQKVRDELDEARSQVTISGMKLETYLEDEKRRAQEEIASLQQLVHETVEESSSSRSLYDCEIRKLHQIIQQLENDNKELKSLGSQSSPHHTAQESGSLAPSVMLSAVTKTLVRKLGADAFSSQDNLEESMRKAQEDAEMLRSLVVPLEEEIKALKDKLRSTDDQLQKCRLCGHNPDQENIPKFKESTSQNNEDPTLSNAQARNDSNATDNNKGAESPPPCDMCSNYEAQLVREQQRNSDLEGRLTAAEKAMEKHKEDLLKEIGFRKDMEEKWNEKKEEHKQQVSELNKRTLCAEQDLQELRRTFSEYYTECMDQLSSLTRERERVHEQLNSLQKENDYLVGKYSVHSQQLQSEAINLPDTVEELQEKLLKLQEDLIIAKVAKEAAQENERTLQGDIVLFRDQLSEREKIENELLAEISTLNKHKQSWEKEKKHYISMQEKFETNQKSLQEQLTGLKYQLDESLRTTKHLEDSNSELRSRVGSLQQELDTSETVQKDFVRLSQSLQVQLEKIRASDTQVRWQHEDDVEECPNCRSGFSGARRKQHCLHCGQIFCVPCLSHTVPSGPKQRPSKVCDVCHTLLVRSSAPYFSTEAPHSPD